MKASALLALMAMTLGSGASRAIERPYTRPHFGTPQRISPRWPRKSRWWHQPPGYYAYTVPLKHANSPAKRAARHQAILDSMEEVR